MTRCYQYQTSQTEETLTENEPTEFSNTRMTLLSMLHHSNLKVQPLS